MSRIIFSKIKKWFGDEVNVGVFAEFGNVFMSGFLSFTFRLVSVFLLSVASLLVPFR